MENRKRNIQMKFYVTEEEKRLIDEKMKQLPIKQYCKKIIQQLKGKCKMLAITIVLFVVPHNQQFVTIRQFFTYRISLFRNQNLNIQKRVSRVNCTVLRLPLTLFFLWLLGN